MLEFLLQAVDVTMDQKQPSQKPSMLSERRVAGENVGFKHVLEVRDSTSWIASVGRYLHHYDQPILNPPSQMATQG